MIELIIDGRAVELSPECTLALFISIEALTEPASQLEQQFEFEIPFTALNRSIMQFAEQTLASRLFNQSPPTGRLVVNGIPLFRGNIELVRSRSRTDGSGSYLIRLLVPPPEWIRLASRSRLMDLPLAYEEILSADTIQESWSDSSPLRFLPVKRDDYPDYGNSQVKLQELNDENYHPFVQIKSLLDGIMEQAGYRIKSQFLNEDFFKSLYMSGYYPAHTDPQAFIRMDFAALRSAESATATADSQGRIMARGTAGLHQVGNWVDAPLPYSGNPYDEAARWFGESFRMMDGRPAFVPDQDIVAGFQFECRYSTRIRLGSPSELIGVDKILWDGATVFDTVLNNPLPDRKNIPGSAGDYWIFCTPELSEREKRLSVYDANGAVEVFDFSGTLFPVHMAFDPVRTTLEYETDGNYQPAEENRWALYADQDYS
ncbi:MAG: hypothetical protein LUD68_03430 [Rikenellaceae bacterium]|nr:hypothetical protein [Rikenellaceae bacterium]